MAGVTNHAFRIICRRLGAGIVYTEMISSYALHFRNSKTSRMLDWTPEERPVAAQIFGDDPEIMAEAAGIVADAGADVIDMNFGCPVSKVTRSGAGAALMRDVPLARKIMEAVVRVVKVPVTVKTRKGPDSSTVTAIELARVAEDAGLAAVAVHGRTAAQGYSGDADWEIIRKVKAAVRIPVIGNGDAKSPPDAVRMLDETGCDGVMIGRACLGDPWIFRRVDHYMRTGQLLPEPTRQERVACAIEHLRGVVGLLGEDTGTREMRGMIGWYVRGVPGASALRRRLTQCSTVQEMETALGELGTSGT
ncbi:MAG: tRNA dihydrouridine synthase DusB [Armatimonadetes bacterium]|nr:tRNA dihydrouridine synthase DusB [Armatimonadota bacterium]